ncbi:hypothetical protein RND71_004101 [Anisodus tanguticus]|uniref:Pectinesterase inhibitor domain-containing protein n=1 Tax=Anisodus tanguticus TaxID=243964 RepID=A0AAE1SX02_9SOLA|nr:hypothetical protein RND71_004101 [Anisodus tanguticus]
MENSLGSAFVAVFAVSGSVVLVAMRVHKHLLSDFMNKLELEIDKDQAKKKVMFSNKVVELGSQNKDKFDDESLESMPLNWQVLYKGILSNKTLRAISYMSLSPNGSPSSSSPPSLSSAQNLEIPNGEEVILGNKDSVNRYVDSLMKTSVSKTEQFLDNIVEKRLSDPTSDAFVKDCLLVCKEVYENAVNAMKKTMEDIEKGFYYIANVDLSALSTNLETCMDCVKEIYGEDQEFIKFDNWAEKITNDALEKIAGFSS